MWQLDDAKSGGANHLPYLLSILSMAVMLFFFRNVGPRASSSKYVVKI